jgi:erythromycin esterase-like protein
LLRLIRLVALPGLLLMPSPAWAQQTDAGGLVVRVADAVCGKQVVILGELPSHGEARAFQAKAEIVQRLVEPCGFDALLFEAPMYDFVGFQEAVTPRSRARKFAAIAFFCGRRTRTWPNRCSASTRI